MKRFQSIFSPPKITQNLLQRKKCEDYSKYMAGRVISTTIMHPLSFARVLMQLGHERKLYLIKNDNKINYYLAYPIERGKHFYIGNERNYLPSIAKYRKSQHFRI
jgi:hypothetical protein